MEYCLTLLFFQHSVEVTLHSILTCRLMISIREAGQSGGYRSDIFELSDAPHHSAIAFARGPQGKNTNVDPETGAGPSGT